MIVVHDKLSTAKVLDQGTKFTKGSGPDVGRMIVSVMRVGLTGKYSNLYSLFEYSLPITQNLYVFFLFLPHCPCPEILTNRHHKPRPNCLHVCFSTQQNSCRITIIRFSKILPSFSLVNYSKIDLKC